MAIAVSPNWRNFGLQWFGACVATKLLQLIFDGFAGMFASMAGLDRPAFLLALVVFRPIGAALGGWVQWLVLRQWLLALRPWVLATSLGSAIALVVVNLLWGLTLAPSPAGAMGAFAPPISVLPQFVFEGIYGLVLGVAQWLVLKTKVSQAGGWILASAVGFLLTSVGTGLLQQILGPLGLDVSQGAWNPFFWAIAAISAALYAALTGGFLVWRLRQRPPQA
jgi:hypothetical protein